MWTLRVHFTANSKETISLSNIFNSHFHSLYIFTGHLILQHTPTKVDIQHTPTNVYFGWFIFICNCQHKVSQQNIQNIGHLCGQLENIPTHSKPSSLSLRSTPIRQSRFQVIEVLQTMFDRFCFTNSY